ncbi:hypothetical protein ACQJBY_071323 [Aegilops geniculata]
MADDSKDISRLLNPADKLTEDLLIEILSRVPYKSLCRFNCNGLLLCRRFEAADSRAFDYVVCNPGTEKWVALPLPGFFSKWQTARLGFDPAVSSHFHVFLFVEDDDDDSDGHVKGVEIYSSKTGVWSHKDSGWGFPARLMSLSAFGNGFLHFAAIRSAVVAVDVEGTTWRVIPMPCNPFGPEIDLAVGFTDLSQGRLYLANIDHRDGQKLLIWVLEDYGSEVWVLKHSVSPFDLLGAKYVHRGIRFHIVAHHPQRNMIFLVYGHDKELMSYEMDSGKVQFIGVLGNGSMGPYLPYVPLYSEELADWN